MSILSAHKPKKKSFWTSLFTLEKNELVHFKIIPDYSINNRNNESLVKSLSYLYQTPKERLTFKPWNLTFKAKSTTYFNIILLPQGTGFYISVPKQFSDMVRGKAETIWNKADISEVTGKELKSFTLEESDVCDLTLKDYNFKSLSADRGNLYPLNNMLGITKELQEGEKVRVNFSIDPVKRSDWVNRAKDEYSSFSKGIICDKEKSTKEIAGGWAYKLIEFIIMLYIEMRILILESILGIFTPEHEEEKEKIEIKIDSLETIKEDNKLKGLSTYTTHKMTSDAFNVNINVISQSSNKIRRKINLISTANAFKDLNGDNELIIRELKNKEKELTFNSAVNFKGTFIKRKNIFSDREVAKFIQMPQKSLQDEYKLERIDTMEIDIPQELQDGKIEIGTANLQGKKIKSTWPQNKNVLALPKILIGPQNAGKTTTLKKVIKQSHQAQISNIMFDFIEDCDSSKEIAETIPNNEKIIIKLGTKESVTALAYNEVSKLITEEMDPWERIRLANLLAEQVEYLINAVSDKATGELTAPMIRYLHAACMVVFIKPYAKINDVFQVLRKWQVRNEFLRYAKYSNCFDEDDDIFYDLEELHDRDKDGRIIGTKENLIIGITNRITILQKNPYLKAMLKAKIDTDFDFTDHIQQGKSIFIQMPQNIFPNKMVKDILCTYYMSRIWLAVQLRKDNKNSRLCQVIFDEVHQVKTCSNFIKDYVTEFRRHRLGLIITCHFLKQFGELLPAIKSAGSSYMLLAGTEKLNLEKLKEELQPFEIQDGLNLKPFHSLNIINYGNQYAKFISALPNPM